MIRLQSRTKHWSILMLSFLLITLSSEAFHRGNAQVPSLCGDYELITPSSAISPGKVAVAFRTDAVSASMLTGAFLNSVLAEPVLNNDTDCVAIVDLPASGNLELTLEVNCKSDEGNAISDTIMLGTIEVFPGEPGTPPELKRLVAKNKKGQSAILKIKGKSFAKPDFDGFIRLAPSGETESKAKIKRKKIKAKYDSCIPDGSYANIFTKHGTVADLIKVKGQCQAQ